MYVRFMPEPLHPVYDSHGRTIGTVQLVRLGRSKAVFWDARALDGGDLGAHPVRADAEEAITDDWEASRPRDPRSPAQRFRPILARGTEPLYLGN